jgi:hypothetical protein
LTPPPEVPQHLPLVLGTLVWIPVAIWTVSLIQWMITQDVDGLSGFFGVCLGIVLAILTFKPPEPIWSPICFAVVCLTVLLFPVVRAGIDKRALISIDLDTLAKAYRTLEERPDNLGARMKVARLVYNRGLNSHAVGLAERALKGLPESLFTDEYKLLATWRLAGGPGGIRPQMLPCLECGLPNPPGELHCARCGAPFLLHHARGNWLGPNLARKVVSFWAGSMLVFAGLTLVNQYLHDWVALIVSIGVLGLACVFFARAFLPEAKRK